MIDDYSDTSSAAGFVGTDFNVQRRIRNAYMHSARSDCRLTTRVLLVTNNIIANFCLQAYICDAVYMLFSRHSIHPICCDLQRVSSPRPIPSLPLHALKRFMAARSSPSRKANDDTAVCIRIEPSLETRTSLCRMLKQHWIIQNVFIVHCK